MGNVVNIGDLMTHDIWKKMLKSNSTRRDYHFHANQHGNVNNEPSQMSCEETAIVLWRALRSSHQYLSLKQTESDSRDHLLEQMTLCECLVEEDKPKSWQRHNQHPKLEKLLLYVDHLFHLLSCFPACIQQSEIGKSELFTVYFSRTESLTNQKPNFKLKFSAQRSI